MRRQVLPRLGYCKVRIAAAKLNSSHYQSMLNLASSGKVQKITWREVDLVKQIGSVPGQRITLGVTGKVQLYDAALKRLKARSAGA